MNIDIYIKTTFKLFEGVRKKEEDEKIYKKLQSHCALEILRFFEEHLPEEKLKELSTKLEALREEDTEHALALLITYGSSVEDARYRLEKRIQAYLNNLLARSLTNAQTAAVPA